MKRVSDLFDSFLYFSIAHPTWKHTQLNSESALNSLCVTDKKERFFSGLVNMAYNIAASQMYF